MFEDLKKNIVALKKESVVIYHALFHPKTPFIAKFFAGLTLIYLLSPIDLIPDFIPVLGLLDDLLLVPIFIKVTLHFIPQEILAELRAKYTVGKLKKNWVFALPIIFIYIILLVLLYFRFFLKRK